MTQDKRASMTEAVAQFVRDGDSLAIEGFTAFICFAAGHEVVRQGRRNVTLIRMTPDALYDQMVAAGVASKLVFSYLGNPGVGPLHCIRRAVEEGLPRPIELEEYSHGGMVARYQAGATGLPFQPLKSYAGTDLPRVNPAIRFVDDPYGSGQVAVVPALRPDIAFIHAQRADVEGNTHIWGLVGMQKEVAFAARKVVVVVEPYGAHPSYVQGYYDRDNAFYLDWDRVSREPQLTTAWIEKWIFDVRDRKGYLTKLGDVTLQHLRPQPLPAAPIDYGEFR